jgi:hypothetical protein
VHGEATFFLLIFQIPNIENNFFAINPSISQPRVEKKKKASLFQGRLSTPFSSLPKAL